jgi:hypothetical protein
LGRVYLARRTSGAAVGVRNSARYRGAGGVMSSRDDARDAQDPRLETFRDFIADRPQTLKRLAAQLTQEEYEARRVEAYAIAQTVTEENMRRAIKRAEGPERHAANTRDPVVLSACAGLIGYVLGPNPEAIEFVLTEYYNPLCSEPWDPEVLTHEANAAAEHMWGHVDTLWRKARMDAREAADEARAFTIEASW